MRKTTQILTLALFTIIILASGCTQQIEYKNSNITENTTAPSFPNASTAKPPQLPNETQVQEPSAPAQNTSQPAYSQNVQIMHIGDNVTIGNYTIELTNLSSCGYSGEHSDCILASFNSYNSTHSLGEDGNNFLDPADPGSAYKTFYFVTAAKKVTEYQDGTPVIGKPNTSYQMSEIDNFDVINLTFLNGTIGTTPESSWIEASFSLSNTARKYSLYSVYYAGGNNGTFLLHVGDNVTIGDYTVQLSDIGLPLPVTRGYPAVFSIYDKNGNLLTQQQAFPLYDEYGNQTTENTNEQVNLSRLNGDNLTIKVFETQPGLTLSSMWANVSISLQTAQEVEPAPAPHPVLLHVGENATVGNYTIELTNLSYDDVCTSCIVAGFNTYDINHNLMPPESYYLMPSVIYLTMSRGSDYRDFTFATGKNQTTEYLNGTPVTGKPNAAYGVFETDTSDIINFNFVDGNIGSTPESSWLELNFSLSNSTDKYQLYGVYFAPDENNETFLVHIFENVTVGNYAFRLEDVGLAVGDNNLHPAVISIYNQSGSLMLYDVSIFPGSNYSWCSPDGKTFTIQINDTSPGYSVFSKWAEISVSSSNDAQCAPHDVAPPCNASSGDNCWLEFATGKNDPSLCLPISVYSRDDCYFDIAVATGNSSTCNSIQGSYDNPLCLAELNRDPLECDKLRSIPDSGLQDYNPCYQKVAEITGNTTICDKFVTDAPSGYDSEDITRCYAGVADTAKNLTICDSSPAPSECRRLISTNDEHY